MSLRSRILRLILITLLISLAAGACVKHGAAQKKVGGAVALVAVVSPVFLLKKVKDAVIPPGYEMQGTVANAAEIALL